MTNETKTRHCSPLADECENERERGLPAQAPFRDHQLIQKTSAAAAVPFPFWRGAARTCRAHGTA